MSTSDLYILNGKSTTHLSEFQNGYGSAPICWDFIGKKYISDSPAYSMDIDHLKKVWALANQAEIISDDERLAMMLTFDGAFIPLENLIDAAEKCKAFGEKCADGHRVNHWPCIADALGAASTQKHNRHAIGVALSCTSVSDPWQCAGADQLGEAWSVYK